mgnify:CR=1 FL=1
MSWEKEIKKKRPEIAPSGMNSIGLIKEFLPQLHEFHMNLVGEDYNKNVLQKLSWLTAHFSETKRAAEMENPDMLPWLKE